MSDWSEQLFREADEMEAQVPDYDDEPDYHGRRSDIARVANDDELAAMFESLAADTQPPASD